MKSGDLYIVNDPQQILWEIVVIREVSKDTVRYYKADDVTCLATDYILEFTQWYRKSSTLDKLLYL
jgi:hypothetical protein